jgi:putative membrane protein
MISNFAFSSKSHLRTNEDFFLNDIINCTGFNKNEIENDAHIPNLISSSIFNKTHELYRNKIITGYQLITIDTQIKSFIDVIGGCERIKNTPIPYSYNIFLKKFIFIYGISLPFGLVSDLGYWAIPISTFILYVLCSLELLAEEIEDPFGIDANDLPLDALCNGIKKNVSSILLNKQTN